MLLSSCLKKSTTQEVIMARGRKLTPLNLTQTESLELKLLVQKDQTRISKRARIILDSASGATNMAIAQQENTTPQTVIYWRNRFLKERIQGLQGKPRPGRPLSSTADGKALVVTEADRNKLQQLIRRAKTSQNMALRARIIIECADGHSNKMVANNLDITPQTVGKWRKRYFENGLEGLLDQPRQRRHPLEHPFAGQGLWIESNCSGSDLAGVCLATPPY
jgi:transposase